MERGAQERTRQRHGLEVGGSGGALGRVISGGSRVEGHRLITFALRDVSGKRKKPLKQVAWADEVGGELLKIFRCHDVAEATITDSSKGVHRDHVHQQKGSPQIAPGGSTIGCHDVAEATIADSSKGVHRDQNFLLNEYQQKGSPRIVPGWSTNGGGCRVEGGSIYCSLTDSRSYKEALVWGAHAQPADSSQRQLHSSLPPTSRAPSYARLVKRCFRCLARDHVVEACRDPVRCLRCRRTGHRAKFCSTKLNRTATNMNRALHHRGRPPLAKVYVPYTKEYLRRVELRRNALLADVIPPANLGQDPIITIKSALASRFGGTTTILRLLAAERGILPSSCRNGFRHEF
uniref:CCHC-type domain-containing protein n=1 Tax=Ananas comosus var. bracteatus TaxID=296719 RepID=A0A6V7NW88_ANACO|nr:unnamed protein product [Ananas comosus var. bracteatus]